MFDYSLGNDGIEPGTPVKYKIPIIRLVKEGVDVWFTNSMTYEVNDYDAFFWKMDLEQLNSLVK